MPETNVLSLPFLFSGTDQMHKARDGEIGQTTYVPAISMTLPNLFE